MKTRYKKYCLNCFKRYEGQYSICNRCVKERKRRNLICFDCRNPDCMNPVLINTRQEGVVND